MPHRGRIDPNQDDAIADLHPHGKPYRYMIHGVNHIWTIIYGITCGPSCTVTVYDGPCMNDYWSHVVTYGYHIWLTTCDKWMIICGQSHYEYRLLHVIDHIWSLNDHMWLPYMIDHMLSFTCSHVYIHMWWTTCGVTCGHWIIILGHHIWLIICGRWHVHMCTFTCD